MRAARGRRLRGKAFHAAVAVPTVLALALLAALMLELLSDTVSWQVVEPRGSGETFSFLDGFSITSSWEKVVTLELAARGSDQAEIDALIRDPEERRKFAARNRVELMLWADGKPLRWVVTGGRDVLVQDRGLLEGWRQRGELSAGLKPGQHLYLNPWLDISFFTKSASRTPLMAGLAPALLGSLWIIGLVMLIAVPLGVGAAIYLEEYAGDNAFTRLLEVNLRNLAGVPSIVYGILGLTVFVRLLGLGPVILAAALTLSLLVVPVVVIASREGIRGVPNSLRQAAYGLGATRSQVVFRVVLPAALSSVVTGVILAVARALGETAPLLVIGAAVFVPGLPNGPLAQYTALPIQIYTWVGENEREFAHVASAGIVVLLAMLSLLYGAAFWLRRKYEKRW